jgi:hypothetical protein
MSLREKTYCPLSKRANNGDFARGTSPYSTKDKTEIFGMREKKYNGWDGDHG